MLAMDNMEKTHEAVSSRLTALSDPTKIRFLSPVTHFNFLSDSHQALIVRAYFKHTIEDIISRLFFYQIKILYKIKTTEKLRMCNSACQTREFKQFRALV